ncbi:hypothetical protein GYMLUDRAFT_247001 [Collybiopsis luxurians FD-317 M1]|uniref:C2H2-type domain-containing protein n=1 Tax=Collybiopsis luxurians FD-317 M1 TaxID=944289 RepID=A0A0D0CPR0_9AGAR|nr:hypothetical protein GYMLUDRAFT_247001 [Collybiopsis luxurians FD-317 M1]
MPKSQAPKTESSRDPTVCELCGTKVARKGDVPRHMQSHLSAEEKASISYSCPYEDCSYKSLQKVNVDTHIRKHTKVKDLQCPACDFATVFERAWRQEKSEDQTEVKGKADKTHHVVVSGEDYMSQSPSQRVEAPPSEASSPSQSAFALDAGYEPLLFADETDSYVPSKPSGRRLGLADILSDDVCWH